VSDSAEGADRFPVEFGTVFIPSLVYLAGAALAAAGLVLWPTHLGAALLAASVGAGEAGGFLAQRLGAGSRFGGELDWTSDELVACAIAWRCFPLDRAPFVFVGLVLWSAIARRNGWRATGRLALTVGAIVALVA
jgi:phosphatidylglycerophosphate synthase